MLILLLKLQEDFVNMNVEKLWNEADWVDHARKIIDNIDNSLDNRSVSTRCKY